MNIDSIVAAFRDSFPTLELDVRTFPIDETVVTLPSDSVHPAVRLLLDRFNLYHLSTITGDDVEGEIVLSYHLWDGRGLTLRTSLPTDSPCTPTITDLIPGAAFYEREVHDLYGVVFDGHPDPRPLLLPDDWEEGPEMYSQERVPSE